MVEVNEAAARLLGRPAGELIGRPCEDVVAARTPAGDAVSTRGWHPSALLRSVRAIPEHDLVVTTANGDVVVRATGRYQRDGDGSLTGAVIALRARRVPGDEPYGAEVVSTVSHELRSPLTSVKGYTSLLLNRWDRLTDDQKRMMLEQVHSDADRVTRLITELLDISRLETGRLMLRRQRVDLPELAGRVVERLALTYEGLDCEVVFPGDFPKVYADPDKLEQVLTNLVENAAKYASVSGMRMAGEVLDGAVTVAVHDRGGGIPERDLPQVFRKFFRGDHGRPTGTGLGLWLSRGLVEAHGGRLTASSVEGRGSVFRFSLPLVDVDDLIE
ncbi:ATP-binding protein [soil metagenome]